MICEKFTKIHAKSLKWSKNGVKAAKNRQNLFPNFSPNAKKWGKDEKFCSKSGAERGI